MLSLAYLAEQARGMDFDVDAEHSVTPSAFGSAVLDESESDDTERSYLLMQGHLETDQHLSERSGNIAGSDKVIIEGDGTSHGVTHFVVDFDGRLYCKVWADPHDVDSSGQSRYKATAEALVASYVDVQIDEEWTSFWALTEDEYDYVMSDSVSIEPEQTSSSEIVIHASFDPVQVDYDTIRITNYLFGMVSLESDRYDPFVRVHGRVRSKLATQDPDPVSGKVVAWGDEGILDTYYFE
jgi:hypothetical protein